jgi:hypothetical protein
LLPIASGSGFLAVSYSYAGGPAGEAIPPPAQHREAGGRMDIVQLLIVTIMQFMGNLFILIFTKFSKPELILGAAATVAFMYLWRVLSRTKDNRHYSVLRDPGRSVLGKLWHVLGNCIGIVIIYIAFLYAIDYLRVQFFPD